MFPPGQGWGTLLALVRGGNRINVFAAEYVAGRGRYAIEAVRASSLLSGLDTVALSLRSVAFELVLPPQMTACTAFRSDNFDG